MSRSHRVDLWHFQVQPFHKETNTWLRIIFSHQHLQPTIFVSVEASCCLLGMIFNQCPSLQKQPTFECTIRLSINHILYNILMMQPASD